MMMMMMMNCFGGMVDRRKTFSLISSRDHRQRSSPSPISYTPQAVFEFRVCAEPEFNKAQYINVVTDCLEFDEPFENL